MFSAFNKGPTFVPVLISWRLCLYAEIIDLLPPTEHLLPQPLFLEQSFQLASYAWILVATPILFISLAIEIHFITG